MRDYTIYKVKKEIILEIDPAQHLIYNLALNHLFMEKRNAPAIKKALDSLKKDELKKAAEESIKKVKDAIDFEFNSRMLVLTYDVKKADYVDTSGKYKEDLRDFIRSNNGFIVISKKTDTTIFFKTIRKSPIVVWTTIFENHFDLKKHSFTLSLIAKNNGVHQHIVRPKKISKKL